MPESLSALTKESKRPLWPSRSHTIMSHTHMHARTRSHVLCNHLYLHSHKHTHTLLLLPGRPPGSSRGRSQQSTDKAGWICLIHPSPKAAPTAAAAGGREHIKLHCRNR